MSRNLLIVGCVAILVGLGFVFPQLANLRMQGHLVAGEISMLFFGLLLSLGGLCSAAIGVRACVKTM